MKWRHQLEGGEGTFLGKFVRIERMKRVHLRRRTWVPDCWNYPEFLCHLCEGQEDLLGEHGSAGGGV